MRRARNNRLHHTSEDFFVRQQLTFFSLIGKMRFVLMQHIPWPQLLYAKQRKQLQQYRNRY